MIMYGSFAQSSAYNVILVTKEIQNVDVDLIIDIILATDQC